jgi:hypothetical protein
VLGRGYCICCLLQMLEVVSLCNAGKGRGNDVHFTMGTPWAPVPPMTRMFGLVDDILVRLLSFEKKKHLISSGDFKFT